MKLGKQLFLIFGIATVVPMAILWFWLDNAMYQQKVSEVKERHLLIAKNLRSALDRYQTDVETGFDVVVDNLAISKPISNADKIVRNLHFRHFCIADFRTGKIIASASPNTDPCPKFINNKRLNEFKTLVKNHGNQTVFSPVWRGPDNLSLIYVVKKIRNKLAIGALRTDYFLEIGKAVSFGKKGHAAIVDQEGNILSHPKSSWVSERKNIAKISAVKRMLAGENGVEIFYSPALNADMIAGLAGAKGGLWSVMVPQPISELRSAARETTATLYPILALFILIVGLTATFVANLILSPLKHVMDGADAIVRGKKVEVSVGPDWRVPKEFQDLQDRFNVMAKSVAKYQKKQRRACEKSKQESKGNVEYLANLAHELKTPLNSILGFSSVLKQAKPGALPQHEQNEFLGHIEKSAGHMLGFVNDLLDLNRLDMGERKLDEHEIYLIEPIRFCEATVRKSLKEKEMTLEIECQNRDLKILADERSINQIMINLMSNAVRYSFDKSTVRIEIIEQNDGSVKILVQDNGIGIPQEDLETIMQPFKRSSDPQIAEIHGTGLGLSIVKKLAALHQIDFSIESEHGFSTTATLIIPKQRVVSKAQKQSAA